MKNKILYIISIILFFIAVISFNVNVKTNFIWPKKPIKKEMTISVLINGNIKTLSLEEYVVGVVAGEMPASFNIEALKAQAIASRTYALYHKNNGKNTLTNTIDDQVYIEREEMINKWGSSYENYYNKIKNAVNDTKGLIMTYNGEIIESFYFSMSSGYTQNSVDVFKENIEYLVSVPSEYDNSSINNFEVKKTFNNEEFKNILQLNCGEIVINNIIYNDNHYIKTIEICNKVFDGNEFRNILKLRSADFTIDINDNILITTRGYGHGVGMSQYGANGYANNGYNYEEILKHYYKNIEIISIN